jgi:NAD(P)-dependent dehydrogenase (short-subunit alcohol dehydrogenase family)
MKSALITGANKGIGLATAKELLQNEYFVYIGCRDIQKGEVAVNDLLANGFGNIKAIELDVTNSKSILSAKNIIEKEQGKLDVLINNAGISGGFPQSALTATLEQFYSVFATNLFGVVSVTQIFVELLKKSEQPRIVNVSTAMASITIASNPESPTNEFKTSVYQSSKAALNMYTVNLAYELRDSSKFKINMVCPGYTQTDFTGHQGTSTPEQAGKRIAKYAMIDEKGPTGKFISEEYFPEPASCPW